MDINHTKDIKAFIDSPDRRFRELSLEHLRYLELVSENSSLRREIIYADRLQLLKVLFAFCSSRDTWNKDLDSMKIEKERLQKEIDELKATIVPTHYAYEGVKKELERIQEQLKELRRSLNTVVPSENPNSSKIERT